MGYQVLALKYRPQTFDEIWAQDHIKETLKRAIEQNKIAHAYLFAGPRGVGKTTTARILAKSLCCVKGPTTTPCNECSICKEITASRNMDVLEIDGASNRRIEEIRELRENIKYLPTSARYKIYIIDEVHMLTTEAFNALLKTLEEPPKNVVFIFATTAPHKVPGTILSRCQRFDFRKATVEEIQQRLDWLTKKENIKITPEALHAIARRADGAIRDAEVILDQLWAFRPEGITPDAVYELLGIVPTTIFEEYAELLTKGDQLGLVQFIDKIFAAGYDTIEFFTSLIEYFRSLLMIKLGLDSNALGLLPDDYTKRQMLSQRFEQTMLLTIINTLCSTEEQVKRSLLPKTLLEVVSLRLVRLCLPKMGEVTGISDKVVESKMPAEANFTTNPTSNNRTNLDTLWQELLTRLRAQKLPLASRLELATPLRLEGNILYVQFPANHSVNRDHFEAGKVLAEAVLGELINKPAKIISELAPTQSAPSSANNQKPSSTNFDLKKIGNVFEYEEIE
ncbi:MAG: DNA polymerase III subunit gamma/tau [candidate division WOR-3 bacterium]